MSKVLNTHKLYKPATMASHREFKYTARLNTNSATKKRRKNRSTGRGDGTKTPADVKNDAFEAITMIELLRKREREIAIEEINFNEQRLSNKATLILDNGSFDAPKVNVSGHFEKTLNGAQAVIKDNKLPAEYYDNPVKF